jgi:hypothetical protein
MRFPSIRVIALLGGLAVAGCGASDINHGGGGGTGGTGGGGTGGAGGGGTGGTGGSGGGGGITNDCGVMNFMLTKGGTPDLLIVQDRSGSMADPATTGSTGSKWSQITPAIEQVVGSVTSVNWGLLFFGPDGFGGGSCTVSSTPQVACGMNTATAITSAINATSPTTSTPTAEAINAAVQYFSTNTDGNTHYILLSTDGLPACDSNDDSAAAEAAVTAAVTAGIKTVVVGIGDDPTGDATLTAMANGGGMPNMTAGQKAYYQVNTTSDLVTALGNIAGQLVSCSYPLSMAPPNPDYVEIDDNAGMKIPHDTTHMDGWDYGPNDLSIIFYGAACDNLQKGVTTGISAVFGCPPVA